ncbi:NACHT, LRR and PYD domains-containing protein 11 isoform X2 [Tamandua tetradactyla]|uniref:NACHT, LRR and PYD domains-containing protein 11 isoform X2 n=1 Tax=Tamandua tetradactyla TaxID=48850 RepID=UPI0040541003
MAESISAEFDLMWYLENLSNKEFQSFKDNLEKVLKVLKLPTISWLELRKSKLDLANKLTTFYEAQHIWNAMFHVFQKIRRNDLCEDIIARRNRNKERHKVVMKERFLLHWREHIFPCVDDEFFIEIAAETINIIDLKYNPEDTLPSNDLNILLVGDRASGKTMLLKKIVLEWVNGKIWKDVISYIVYITSDELNQMTKSSLVELISKHWPSGLAPVADILSDPKKLLFILEDLDNLNITLNIDESTLCSDSRQQVSASVLLVSLLKRKMAPGSLFLISSRPNRQAALKAFMKDTDFSVRLELSDEKRQKYFNLFFKDVDRATKALRLVQENEVLLYLCRVPVVCWITCSALRQGMDEGHDIKLACETLTDIYAHFLANTLTSEAGMTVEQHLVRLGRLCSLALEGLIHDTLEFSGEDLMSVGFTEAEVSVLQSMKILMKSGKRENHYMFIHLSVQEFCAAIGYMMALSECQLPSAKKEDKDRRERYNDFSPILNFTFGLLNEKRRKILETSFGCKLLTKDVMQYFLQQTKCLGDNPRAVIHHLPLFHALFENQEDELVEQIMGFFLEATIFIQENKDLVVFLYCLKHCHTLKKLRLCVQGILTQKQANMRLTSRLTHFPVKSRFEDLFKAIIHNQNLMHLSLSHICISQRMFLLLHEVMENPMCNIQHLSLMKCDLRDSECEEIAFLLISNKKLKQLNLSNNPLSNAGVKILCDALLHPECALESLVLLFCCLTKTCCSSLGRVLMINKTLKHLDLSVNYLQDHGILVLTLPMMFTTCKLQELELSGCFFNSCVCRDIASVIVNNQNLRTLELGSNNVGDEGVELLCNALKHPNCKLENLGLEECMLTTACCEAIASVIINNKTLKKLNLLRNELGDEGIVQLLEALRHPNCTLQTVGLQISDVSPETLKLLMAVKEKNTKLVLVTQSWAGKKGRKLSPKFDSLSLSWAEPTISSHIWHLISFTIPRKF